MSKLFTVTSIVLAGLVGADYLSVALPPSTNAYEYCLQDYSSGMRKCSFDTLEQCIAVIDGGGGSCDRSPHLVTGSAMAAN